MPDEAHPLAKLPRATPPIVVCPKCRYGFPDAGSKDGRYLCPRHECRHLWEALTRTAEIVHLPDRRVPYPEVQVVSGAPLAQIRLPEGETLIGRDPQCGVLLDSQNVSRRHARLLRDQERVWIEDLGSTRGTRLNGEPVREKTLLVPADELSVGGVVLRFAVRYEPAGHARPLADQFPLAVSRRHADDDEARVTAAVVPLSRGRLTIGRDRDRDLVLSNMLISRRHSLIEFHNERYYLSDTQSLIGTFVNGKSIIRTALEPGDRIQLGPYLFRFDGPHLTRVHELTALEVVAAGLCQSEGDALQLDDVSLLLKPGEFVGLLGPSGAGKTTLLDALAGVRPARSGRVFINGEPLYEEYARLRHLIGYVPHEEIVHPELTARQALSYVGRLRLPSDLSQGELADLVKDALAAVDLGERGELPIGRLSPIERKRASVAVELLCRPGILFLDEPTLGLDPGAESNLLRKFRRLAAQGRTVVCAMHVMENVDVFDQVAVLTAGGKLAYFGPAREAKGYFAIDKFTQLYERLEEKPPETWQERYRQSDQALQLRARIQPAVVEQGRDRKTQAARPASFAAQTAVLTHRAGRILLSDIWNKAALLAQPLLIALLLIVAVESTAMILFMAVVTSLWFGCSNAVLQILRERSVYRRERRVNLRLDAYLWSKFAVLGAVTLVQSGLMLAVIGVARGEGNFLVQLAAMVLAGWNGVALGLIVSALARTSDQALFAVPLCLLPQILLAGGLTPLERMPPPALAVSYLVPARFAHWAMEVSLQGAKVLQPEVGVAFAALLALWLSQMLIAWLILRRQETA